MTLGALSESINAKPKSIPYTYPLIYPFMIKIKDSAYFIRDQTNFTPKSAFSRYYYMLPTVQQGSGNQLYYIISNYLSENSYSNFTPRPSKNQVIISTQF